jgi:hypothetical protein
MGKLKFTDDEIISAYKKTGSIWKAADILGICGQSVHERLVKLGVERSLNHITKQEKDIVKEYYKTTDDDSFYRQDLLKLLPEGTTISRLEHIVTKCGLGKKRKKTSIKARLNLSESKKGKPVHHSGFSGMSHSEESKKKISDASKALWKDENHIFNDPEYRKKMAQNSRRNGIMAMFKNPYSRCKQGYYKISWHGDMFFRSKWEANYALYLTFLEKTGDVLKWEYEPYRFKFPIEHGTVCYTPDFKVYFRNGSIEWHEVKGWMDAKSKTKIKRMAKYYPEEKLIIIGEQRYKELCKMSKIFGFY